MKLVYSKNYFNLAKIFVLRLFKMVANQTECSSLEQRSVIKFFGGREEQTIWNFLKNVLDKKVSKWAKHLPQWAWVKKTVHGVETHWLSSKNKAQGAVVNKEGETDCLLGHERTHDYWFPWKRCNNKRGFLLPTSSTKFNPIYLMTFKQQLMFLTLCNWKNIAKIIESWTTVT